MAAGLNAAGSLIVKGHALRGHDGEWWCQCGVMLGQHGEKHARRLHKSHKLDMWRDEQRAEMADVEP